MDKYEYKVRADEIKELIAQGEYIQAAEIADMIDWRRVKSVMMLCTISDLYKINRRYEDARDMLLLAYERRPGGRTICYSLCELSIKMEEYVQAVEYYKEFVQVAPKDSGRYILQYKLYEAQDVSLEERIEVLEELKKHDYRERWAYELAYLYHRVGLGTRCVEECDEMILWFGEGKYVIKAIELKMLHEPLTPQQQEKYDRRFQAFVPPQNSVEGQGYAETQDYADSQGYGGTQDYADSQGYAETQGYADSQGYADMQGYADSQGYGGMQSYTEAQGYGGALDYAEGQGYGDAPEYGGVQDNPYAEENGYSGEESDQNDAYPSGDTLVYENPHTQRAHTQGETTAQDLDIHVKTMDVGQYNTINLQAELAEGLREVLGEENGDTIRNPITRSIVAPMMESDTETLDDPRIDEVDEEDLGPEAEQIEGSEVFFGETGEIGTVASGQQLWMEDILPEESAEEIPAQQAQDVPAPGGMIEKTVPDVTAEIVMEQMRKEETGEEITGPWNAEPPKGLAEVLSQESDGQISLVMPDRENVEKQITGQMSIEDILAEWERMKRENEVKRKEEVRRHVLQQTGSMFTEFEASVRDGLLEQLENGELANANTKDAPNAAETGRDVKAGAGLSEVEEKDSEAVEISVEEALESTEAEDFAGAEEEAHGGEEPEDFAGAEEEAHGGEEPEDFAGAEEEAHGGEEPEDFAGAEEEAHGSEEPEDFAGAEEAHGSEEPEDFTVDGRENPDMENKEESGRSLSREQEEESALEEPAGGTDENPLAAVEQDKARIRALTKDERELYAPFIQTRTAREQLVQAIDNVSLAAYTGNIIITGEEGMDTLTLAKNMVREIQMEDSNFAGKVAKITGNALNRKDVSTIVSNLENGALIIEKASQMNKKTADSLNKSLQQETRGIVVVLEDTRKAMNRFLAANEELHGCFTARMDVEALSNDMLVSFGRQYAREMEYSIDEMGMLALHTRIEDLQTSDHAVTVMEVKEIVDHAIHHANKKTIGHFIDILLAKRYDDEDMIILGEKDFA